MSDVITFSVPVDKPPCKAGEVLVFDMKNLEGYLEFLRKCCKGNFEYTELVENNFRKKMEIVKKIREDCDEVIIKQSAQTYKIGELENSLENQQTKLIKIDEKFVKLEYEVFEIVKVKELMVSKMGDIDYLLEQRLIHQELIEGLTKNFNASEIKAKEQNEKINARLEDHTTLLETHDSNIKKLEKQTLENSELIKNLTLKVEQQGLVLMDQSKQLKNQNEKMNDMREEIHELKKKAEKIDVLDKRINDLEGKMMFQYNETKKTIDDFALRLKFIDKKMEEIDSNFEVVQERMNYSDEKMNNIEGYNDAFGNQVRNKFEEVEKKFEENDQNMEKLGISSAEIIGEIVRIVNGLRAEAVPKPELNNKIKFHGDLDMKTEILDENAAKKKKKLKKEEDSVGGPVVETKKLDIPVMQPTFSSNLRPSFGEIKTGNPKLLADVEKLKLEVEQLKFDNESIKTNSKIILEDMQKIRSENENLVKNSRMSVYDVVTNPELSKGQKDMIKTVENINSLGEFVYKKDFSNAIEDINVLLEQLRTDFEDFKDESERKIEGLEGGEKKSSEEDEKMFEEKVLAIIEKNPITHRIFSQLRAFKHEEGDVGADGASLGLEEGFENQEDIFKRDSVTRDRNENHERGSINANGEEAGKEGVHNQQQNKRKVGENSTVIIKNEINELGKDLNTLIKRNSAKCDNSIREVMEIIGDGDGPNIRECIRNLQGRIATLNDKIDKVIAKLDGLSTDILNKMQKNLAIESERILEEFKMDLKISISKIEGQLKDKIDRVSLDDLGKKLDSKYAPELGKKLDKKDLKRNNNQMIKKIGDLENKISKTLVDTLIDLQMEDAPLILKRGVLGDKCGSCNQYIMDKDNKLNFNSTHLNVSQYNQNMYGSNSQTSAQFFAGQVTSTNINMNHPQSTKRVDNSVEIKQLRSIQDSSNKYNSGSYSRILNHAMDDNIKDDLKPAPNKLRNSGSQKALPVLSNTQTKPGSKSRAIEKPEESIISNSPFQEVLDRRTVDGNKLVLKANREFEKQSKLNKDNKEVK